MFNLLKIKGRMVELGYTQEKLSKEMGISERSLSNKLLGRSKMALDEFQALMRILKLTYDEITTENI